MEEATQLPKVHVREYVQPLWCGWAEEAGVCGGGGTVSQAVGRGLVGKEAER